MSSPILTRIANALQRLEYAFDVLFLTRTHPPDAFALATAGLDGGSFRKPPPRTFTLKDLVGDGFLWGVPTHRRTLEKRMTRRFGDPFYVEKLIKPKTTLRTCNSCGDTHEVGVLCPTCYKKVIDETKEMQEAIQNELKLSPVDKEVVVLYDGEKADKPAEYWEGKRIVEINKPRPSWFSKNLIQQTTQQPATTTDVKPSELA